MILKKSDENLDFFFFYNYFSFQNFRIFQKEKKWFALKNANINKKNPFFI